MQVDLMESKFKEFMSNESERLDRDVKAAEDKSAAKAAHRAELRRQEWTAICASRTAQVQSKAVAKAAALEQEKEFAAAWKVRACRAVPQLQQRSECASAGFLAAQVRMQQLVEEEQAEAAARRACNRHCAAFQQHQAGRKDAAKRAAALSELQEAAMVQVLGQDADNRFHAYAKEFIEEYQRAGRPVKPMQLMLSKPAPFESA
jgi:hypothetical protein